MKNEKKRKNGQGLERKVKKATKEDAIAYLSTHLVYHLHGDSLDGDLNFDVPLAVVNDEPLTYDKLFVRRRRCVWCYRRKASSSLSIHTKPCARQGIKKELPCVEKNSKRGVRSIVILLVLSVLVLQPLGSVGVAIMAYRRRKNSGASGVRNPSASIKGRPEGGDPVSRAIYQGATDSISRAEEHNKNLQRNLGSLRDDNIGQRSLSRELNDRIDESEDLVGDIGDIVQRIKGRL